LVASYDLRPKNKAGPLLQNPGPTRGTLTDSICDRNASDGKNLPEPETKLLDPNQEMVNTRLEMMGSINSTQELST